MSGKKWRDPEVLERLYLREHLSTYEIGDRLGCSSTTVGNWLERHGIEKQPYDDEEVLRELYWEKRMSTREIGDKFGLTAAGVREVMDRHGIERRDGSAAQRLRSMSRPPYFGTALNGYEVIKSKLDGEVWRCYHHRLLAVAEFGFDAVCGMDVHHWNNIPWDNRPENIGLMTRAEHTRHHHTTEESNV